MGWHERIRDALRSAAGIPDEDVVEELAEHARAMYDAARTDGCSHDEAEGRVGDQIDRWRLEAASLRRRPRRRPGVAPPPAGSRSWFAGLAQDAAYAVRLHGRQWRFALLVILTMALGVGATATLFSVTYGVLIRPLPWRDADRLVLLQETRGGNTPRFGSFSNAAYLAWRGQSSTLEEIAAWFPQTFTLTGAGDPERVRMTAATASLFRALGVRPLIGSLFDDEHEAEPVVVVSEGLWRQRLGGAPDVLGRIVHLDGEPRTIIGVVPDWFGYPDPTARGWVPFRVPPPEGNRLVMFEALAKRSAGATVDQAAAEGTARGRWAADTGGTTTAIFGSAGRVVVRVRPLHEAMTGGVRRALMVLLAAAALLLAVATSNVAGLQLARVTGRRREIAIRAALGAGRGRILRQLVVEALLLGAAGGAGGLAVAAVLHAGLATVLPADFPRIHDVRLDVRVVFFTIAVAGVVSLMFGLLPAFSTRGLNLAEALAEHGTSATGVGGRSRAARARLLIVAGQIATACVLLVCASLLARSFFQQLYADRGFDPSGILIAPIPMSGPGYTPGRRTAIMREIVERLTPVPGVHHAAFTSEAPLTPGGSTSSFTLPARDAVGVAVAVQAAPRLVSSGYFSVLGLRVVLGRSLEASDTESSEGVVVVNETFARRYLGAAPLGVKVPMGVWGGAQRGEATVVGVVEDIRYVGASVTTLPEMYFSERQLAVGMRSSIGTLLVRADGDLASLGAIVRNIVRQTDGALAPVPVVTVEDRLLSTSLARPRLYAVLLGGFAAASLVVTGVGLFGILSFMVAQRTREMGVRVALGATRRDLVVLIVGRGIGVAVLGIVAGLLASAWLTRFVATLLYGVTANDWLTFVAVPAVVLAVAAAACVVPAHRASRLDPMRALKSS